MTIAPRTAFGRSAKSGARTIAVARMSPAVMSDESCDFTPADSAVADCDRLASTVNPPNRPVDTFAAPRPMSSWSGSIS